MRIPRGEHFLWADIGVIIAGCAAVALILSPLGCTKATVTVHGVVTTSETIVNAANAIDTADIAISKTLGVLFALHEAGEIDEKTWTKIASLSDKATAAIFVCQAALLEYSVYRDDEYADKLSRALVALAKIAVLVAAEER